MSVYTRTFWALGAGSRKVMVLSAFTSGERTLVTTLASTPAPRPRPGPLPPGGLLTIWACTDAATSVAMAVAGRPRRIRFMAPSLFQSARPRHRARAERVEQVARTAYRTGAGTATTRSRRGRSKTSKLE